MEKKNMLQKKLLLIKVQSEALLYGKEEHATRVSVSLDDHFRRCKIANSRCCGSCSSTISFSCRASVGVAASSLGLPWPPSCSVGNLLLRRWEITLEEHVCIRQWRVIRLRWTYRRCSLADVFRIWPWKIPNPQEFRELLRGCWMLNCCPYRACEI